ncbi:MAG: hypothetical protein ACQETV_06395 [Actinomycetota bacterium]
MVTLADATWQVGEAGSVGFHVEDRALRLVEVATNPGWTMEVDADRGRTLDVGFRRGDMTWDVEAELADSGRLAVEAELTLQGPYPG